MAKPARLDEHVGELRDAWACNVVDQQRDA
jgi:hypothetical protein